MNTHFNSVYGLEKLTMLDYEKHLSAILFYGGCSIRCPYCYNKGIVFKEFPPIEPTEIDIFLQSRKNKLDAVVFSGGECTIHGDSLYNDIAYCRSLGYKIKVDTNGTNFNLIKRLVNENLVDFIALDYKCPAEKKNIFGFTDTSYINFKNTLELLCSSSVPFEVRTTVHTDIIDEKDITNIIQDLNDIGYQGNFYIQFHFRNAPETIGNVNDLPREFDISQIKDTDKITVKYRNEQDNY